MTTFVCVVLLILAAGFVAYMVDFARGRTSVAGAFAACTQAALFAWGCALLALEFFK